MGYKLPSHGVSDQSTSGCRAALLFVGPMQRLQHSAARCTPQDLSIFTFNEVRCLPKTLSRKYGVLYFMWKWGVSMSNSKLETRCRRRSLLSLFFSDYFKN